MLALDKIAETISAGSTIVAFKPAGSEHHEAAGPETLIWPGVNFLIFFGVCVWIYKNKVSPLLAKRADDFDRFLKQSDAVLQQAEVELSAAESARRNLPTEKERILAQALEDGRNLSASIAEDATKQVAFMKQSLEKRFVSEQHAAEDRLKLKMIERATAISRNSLRKDLSNDQDRSFRERCFQEFVDLVKP
jgi:F0F1-type ATP synthase membrane subunit b/b'